MTDYKGKCAIITGGGAGLGLAMSKLFASKGINVVISGRRKEKLDEAVKDIEAAGGTAIAVQADVARRADVERTINAAIENFGRIDYLINNAHATGGMAAIEDISDELLDQHINSGVRGTLYHIQLALPYLKESKGAIVNFGSRQGTYGAENFGAYGAAKEAIRALSRVAARELGQFGIRVNVINPGAESDATTEYFASSPGAREFFTNETALKRFGKPEDVAPIVLMLCSDEVGYMTGQTLNVDGGQVMP